MLSIFICKYYTIIKQYNNIKFINKVSCIAHYALSFYMYDIVHQGAVLRSSTKSCVYCFSHCLLSDLRSLTELQPFMRTFQSRGFMRTFHLISYQIQISIDPSRATVYKIHSSHFLKNVCVLVLVYY